MLKQKQRASGRNCAGEGSNPMKITVYLGASEGNDPALKTAVQELGRWIGQSGNALVYGGSRSGLMGLLADSVLAAGGQVTGVEPRFFVEQELQHNGLTELIVTENMAQRKAKMIELGDAIRGVSRRHRDAGRDCRGHVHGVAPAAGCALHPLQSQRLLRQPESLAERDDLQGTFLGPAAGRDPFCGRPCPDPCLAGIR